MIYESVSLQGVMYELKKTLSAFSLSPPHACSGLAEVGPNLYKVHSLSSQLN